MRSETSEGKGTRERCREEESSGNRRTSPDARVRNTSRGILELSPGEEAGEAIYLSYQR